MGRRKWRFLEREGPGIPGVVFRRRREGRLGGERGGGGGEA